MTQRALRVSVCSALMVAALTYGVSSAVAADPPPNPTDKQLSQAAAAKQQLATQVGTLSASVVTAQNELNQLSAQAELAEQKYSLAHSQLLEVQALAAQATRDVTAAEQAVIGARANLTTFVHDSYIQPTLSSGAGNLLTAPDPNSLLQNGDYVHYVASSHLDAIGALNRATVAQANAVSKAKALVVRQQQLTTAAATAQATAIQAKQAQQNQTAQLTASLAGYTTQLSAAKDKLASLNGQHATYVAYVKEQARLAAIAAAKAAAARAAAIAEQERIAAANAAAARAAAAAQAQSSNSGSANSSPTGGSVSLPPASSMGSWTPAKGQAAASRALTELGMPYAWAGGNNYGPTYGVNSPGTAGYNDSQVYGFDCSGLVMYAWAPQGLFLAHYAASQYSQAGAYHPSSDNFQPGDLLFWSADGSVGGIHHVAIYIGNGNVIQAPNSGDHVKITPWDQVDWGYFGATRPLTN